MNETRQPIRSTILQSLGEVSTYLRRLDRYGAQFILAGRVPFVGKPVEHKWEYKVDYLHTDDVPVVEAA